MVLDKTVGLFRLAVGLMAAFSDCETDFTPLVNQLALYFQVRWVLARTGGGGWWDISGTQLIYTRFQWYEANVYRIPAVRS